MNPGYKLAVLENVFEITEGEPVEIWCRDGKAVLVAYNECRNNRTEICLKSLLEALCGQPIPISAGLINNAANPGNTS